MRLFNEINKKSLLMKSIVKPGYYKRPDGSIFGSIPLTENNETILPINPNKTYSINKKYLFEWQLVMVSTTQKAVIGECDYFYALNKLEKHIIESDKELIRIKGLTLEELTEICE